MFKYWCFEMVGCVYENCSHLSVSGFALVVVFRKRLVVLCSSSWKKKKKKQYLVVVVGKKSVRNRRGTQRRLAPTRALVPPPMFGRSDVEQS